MASLSDQWPLLLAGPILRRVETQLVTVWVALKQPGAVRLRVWQGIVDAGVGTATFEGPAPLAEGAVFTRRFGDHLHLALVALKPPAPLLPGTLYAYNVALAGANTAAGADGSPDLGKFTQQDDLKSLGLLLPASGDGLPHEPLGYQPGFLPTFATLPADLEDLRILHASCRRIGYEGNDGQSWVDDLILQWFEDPNRDPRTRPHQMFHSGDQIYADDVPVSFLSMINAVGCELIGVDASGQPREHVATRYPFILDPAGIAKITDGLEKISAQKRADLAKELFDTAHGKIDQAALDRRMKEARRLNDPCQTLELQLLADGLTGQGGNVVFTRDAGIATLDSEGLNQWPADLTHFPAGLRENVMKCEAKFTSDDVGRTVGHLISFGEYCAMYLLMWSNACWQFTPAAGATTPAAKPNLPDLNTVFNVPDPLPQLWELHVGRSRAPAGAQQAIRDELKKYREDPKNSKGNQEQLKWIARTFTALPKVRRALANIPNYMIFDDHEMTDDWNINQAWKEAVEGAPFARLVLRNGLMAYTLFQGWGNTPDRFAAGPYKDLIDKIEALFPADLPIGPAPDKARDIDQLLALRGEAPQLHWHYAVQGQRHIVVVLDQRTRRGFRSRFAPPALLNATSLREQIPSDLAHAGDTVDPSQAQTPLPAGIEMLLVVAQTPALLPSAVTALLVPGKTRYQDARNHSVYRNMTGLDPDGEIWPGDDAAFEDFLARLAFYKQVVLLSGDVHFGFAAGMTYWGKTEQLLFSGGADLAAGLNACKLDGVTALFTANNRPLSDQVALSADRGDAEWLLADHKRGEVYLIRLEQNKLNVYLDPPPARIVQFTSSGSKNTIPIAMTIGTRLGFGFEVMNPMPVERLGWHSDQPPQIIVPPTTVLAPPVAAALQLTPLVIPTHGWPAGTQLASQPDFTWRLLLARDERPEAQRPQKAHAEPLPAEFNPQDVLGSYAQIVQRHSTHLDALRHSRGIVYHNNIGKVYFERTPGGLVAVQELLTDALDAQVLDKPFVVAVYRLLLTVFDEERPHLVRPEFPQ